LGEKFSTVIDGKIFYLAAMSSITIITVLTLEPIVRIIYKIKKPSYVKDGLSFE
jgi:hypothetical protein